MYFGSQFNRFQPNLNLTNNHQQINSEEKEKDKEFEYKGGDKIAFAVKRNYISKNLINFCKGENNKRLDELLSDLISFKLEKKILDSMNFKQIIFDHLEKMIIEISCLTNGEIREERIQKLFLWYKAKIKLFEDIRKIQEKSYKEKNEIDDLEILNEKESEKNKVKEEIINEEEKNVKEDLKHRNKDMLYKDMLEDYKRKHIRNKYMSENITKANKELESSPTKNEKFMYKTLSSTSFKNYSHSGEMTTFYSTKNGKNAFTLKKNLGNEEQNYYSLFNLYNKNYIPPLDKETKFSYSYNRPKYDYNTMIIENNIIEKKIKELKEKRTKEEIKEKLDKFGTGKAKYKESIINKYELKNVINMYANTNDFNSNLLQKYKIKSPMSKNNLPKRFSKLKESKLNDGSYDDNMIGNKFEKKENMIRPRKLGRRSYSQIISNNFNFLKEDPKMEINKIKNMDNNTKKILEKEKNEIKVIKIKLKQPKEKIYKKYENLKENYSDIPNDVIYEIFNKNALFKQKFLYDNICNIKFKKDEANIKKDTENDESESEYHNFYMSAYDFGNIKKLEKFSKNSNENNKPNKTRNENIIETFDSNKDNFLNFRKTMNSWKRDNFEKLYNRIKSKENNEQTNLTPESKFITFKRKMNLRQRKQNSLLYAMVNPIEQSLYPTYFLPRNGSMLLKRKTLNEKKGKSKKKKK